MLHHTRIAGLRYENTKISTLQEALQPELLRYRATIDSRDFFVTL